MTSKTLILLCKIVSSNDPTIQKFKLYAISYMDRLHFCKLHHFSMIESLFLAPYFESELPMVWANSNVWCFHVITILVQSLRNEP
jgi:hypothetical protein